MIIRVSSKNCSFQIPFVWIALMVGNVMPGEHPRAFFIGELVGTIRLEVYDFNRFGILTAAGNVKVLNL